MDLSQSSEDSFEVGPTVVSSSFYQSPSKQVRFEGALLSPIEKESRIAPIDSQPKSGAFPYETFGAVSVVECSPFANSPSLIAYGEDSSLSIIERVGSVNQNEVTIRTSEFKFRNLLKFNQGTRIDAIAFSPISNTENSELAVCTAGADKKLRFIVKSSNKNEPKQFIIGEHTSYINGCSFIKNGSSTNLFASVSDDHTCKIWDVETQQTVDMYRFQSPAMSVCWHEQSELFLVAEQNGHIRFFDRRTSSPVSTLLTDCHPLLDADWSPQDPLTIGAVSLQKWYVCKLPRGVGAPVVTTGVAHKEGTKKIRFSTSNPSLFATSGQKNSVSLWDISHPTIPYSSVQKSSRVGGLSWFLDTMFPMYVTGAEKQLNFWFLT